ncbi:MAG: DUF11 domain-containing protein [Clostridia bacterium]|nr:DUF11 domain-containing protein [Clostridia bacterium]
MDNRIEALIATAKAYFARGVYLQYDDTRLVAGNVVEPPVYRWQRHINGPEDSTRQHTCYTNCAAFCYDVYKEALGIDIVTWCTEMMIGAADMHAFRYEVRGDETDEEKATLEKAYRAALRPGDIIVSRHDPKHVGGGGHAMFYIGDNTILHSSAPGGGNYDYEAKADKVEPNGSIAYMSVDELFDISSERRYFFRELNFAIVRPLMKYKDACVTESAANRVANMQNIFAEKLCSHITGQTAAVGDEITFTYYLRNDRDSETTVVVKDTIPQNTEYVSGGDKVEDDSISWSITLGAGDSARFAYSVRITEKAKTGEYIQTIGSVGGVYIRCPKVYIAEHLSEEQQGNMLSACKSLTDAECSKEQLAEVVYNKAGISLKIGDPRDALNGVFAPHKGTDTHFELDANSPYFEILVPTMYGGRYVATSPAFCGVRTSGIFAREIMAGDIIVAAKNAKCEDFEIIVYCGEGACLTVADGKIKLLSNEECDNALMSLPAYYKFAAFRPAMKYYI